MDALEGLSLPSFLDEFSRPLLDRIKAKEAALLSLQREIDEVTARSYNIKKHLSAVNRETDRASRALATQRNVVEETKSQSISLVNEEKQVKFEINEKKKLYDDSVAKYNKNSERIAELKRKVEKLREQIRQQDEEMEYFDELSNQMGEDMDAFRKYQGIDDGRIKELLLKYERLRRAQSEKAAANDVIASEIEGTKGLLRQTAREINLYEGEANVLNARKSELVSSIEQHESEYNEKNAQYKEKIDEQDKLKKLLEAERNEAENTQKAMTEARLELSSLTSTRDSVAAARVEAQTEKEHKQSLLKSKDREVKYIKEKRKLAQKQLEELEKQLKDSQQNETELKRRLDTMNDLLGDKHTKRDEEKRVTEEMWKVLREKEEEKRHQENEKRSVENTAVRNEGLILEVEDRVKKGEGEVREVDSALRGVRKMALQYENEEETTKQRLHDVNFKIMKLRRKLKDLTGVSKDAETQEYLTRIAKLQQTLSEMDGMGKEYNKRITETEYRVEKLQKEVDAKISKNQKLLEIQTNIKAEIQQIQRTVANQTKEREKRIVELSDLEIKYSKLQHALECSVNDVFSLENKKMQLWLTLQEKEKEVKASEDILKSELQMVQEEKHKVTKELVEMEKAREATSNKYEMMKFKSGYEEVPTQAAVILRAKNEVEELKKKRAEAQKVIERHLTDKTQLEATLEELDQAGKVASAGMRTNETDMDFIAQKEKLEEDLRELQVVLKSKRTLSADLSKQLAESRTRIESGNRALRAVQDEAKKNVKMLSELSSSIAEIKEKETRTSLLVDKLSGSKKKDKKGNELKSLVDAMEVYLQVSHMLSHSNSIGNQENAPQNT